MTNATLTEVRAHAPVNAYGDVEEGLETSAELKWSGTRSAYLTRQRKMRTIGTAQAAVPVEVDMLVVRGQLPVEVVGGDAAHGDTVVVQDYRLPYATRRFRVVAVDRRAVGSPVDSIRLELDDERVV